MSLKTWPATPSTKTIGKKTAIVVSVEAITAPPTSPVPRTTASTRESPSSRQRKIDSRTTIELSTSIPIPSAKPPRDMMLSETPNNIIGAKVATTDTGIVRPIRIVDFRLLRNKKRMIMARIPPTTALLRTSSIESRMNTD